MSRLASHLRLLSSASLLALALGMPHAWAQADAATSALSSLRGSADAIDGPEAASETDAASEPAAVAVRDGDIPVEVEPPAGMPDEPVDADTQANPDGTLAADGQADVIVETPEGDPPEEDAAVAPAEAPSDAPADDAALSAAAPAVASDASEGLPTVEPTLRSGYSGTDDNPYAPIGYRIGSFVLFPEIGAETIIDDNVFKSGSSRKSDKALGLREALRVTSDWSRHALEADVTAYQSFYGKYSSEDDRALQAALRGRADITSDTRLDAVLGYGLAQESRGSIDFPSAAVERPDVADRSASLALTQRFNRLSARLRGAFADSRRSGDGLDASEDYDERTIGLRVGYEISPGLQVFGEHDWSERSYTAIASDGLKRDADGRAMRVGAAAEITAKLQGELSVGRLVETPDADALATIEGVIIDGALMWTPSALTTVRLGAQSTVTPASIAGSAGALERSADVEVRHEFRRYLAAIAGVNGTSRDYAGTDISEAELNAHAGLEYLVGRGWVLGADYAHTAFWSSDPDGDYTDNLFRLSGTWRP